AAMAGSGSCVARLAVALMILGVVLAGKSGTLVGAPVDITDPANDSGLQRALHFAMEQYNKGSNDMYASRVVRVIQAQRQIVAGIKYTIEAEIARTTCPKPAADLQSCAFAPQMGEHTICNFVVYTVPWLNKTQLLESRCH
ncbi:CYT protein, partial [Bucorvus abyssinicus]|nr:CYT protein [Bucorvus abyssinicus]